MRVRSWMRTSSWTRPNHLGMLLLGIWLMAVGASQLFSLRVPYSNVVVPALALAAGILIALDVKRTTVFLGVLLVAALGVIAFLFRGYW